jgi:hypothetical protein
VYAQGLLENYLRYYLKERGTIAYRGLEMAQSGRMLTLFAQYWRYTGDSQTLLRYRRDIHLYLVGMSTYRPLS